MRAITFSHETTYEAVLSVIESGVVEWTVNIDHENKGYPHENVMIVGVDEDGEEIVVCECDANGAPIRNSTWNVPLDGLRSITVL